MKKIITSLAFLMFIAGLASGQTVSDALTFGSDNFYGTARTLGMGNAVTAIGGDLGTISFNPAGGSVSAFSQFEFSTGWTTSSSISSYAPSYDSANQTANYTGGFDNSKTRMTIPNIGMNLCFETGNRSGILSWNFAFVLNRSQTYTQMLSASGLENHTSMTGALATFATGMPGTILGNSNKYDTDYAWNSIVAYDGGLINYNNDAGTYYGSAETVTKTGTDYNYEMLGVLKQNIGVTRTGSKNDVVMNYGVNIDNRLFLGASINMPIAGYKYSEYYSETAQDPADFPVTAGYYSKDDNGAITYKQGAPTQYVGSTYKYGYVADVSGINAQIGFIWLPTSGVRIGASIKTPTAYTISEQWYVDVESEFKDASQNLDASTPTAETSYNFRSPYTANFGLAYTLGRAGLISVDYEITDYSVMKFSQEYVDASFTYEDPFYRVNRLNKLFCGVQQNLRLGAEFRLLPSFSLRAGFNWSSSPERHYTDNEGYVIYAADYDRWFEDYESGKYKLMDGSATYSSDKIFSYSFGAGYSSPGSFYADIAFRRICLHESYYSPYSNYLSHTVGGTTYDIVSPSVKSALSQFDAVLTLGWRF